MKEFAGALLALAVLTVLLIGLVVERKLRERWLDPVAPDRNRWE